MAISVGYNYIDIDIIMHFLEANPSQDNIIGWYTPPVMVIRKLKHLALGDGFAPMRKLESCWAARMVKRGAFTKYCKRYIQEVTYGLNALLHAVFRCNNTLQISKPSKMAWNDETNDFLLPSDASLVCKSRQNML